MKGFWEKLIDRLDKLDPTSLQTHFLRLAQERGLLETIFQSIQEGVLVIDGAGALTYANKAAEHLLGFAFETSRGKPVRRYIRDIDWERLLALDITEWSRLVNREIEVSYPEHRFISFYIVPLAHGDRSERGAVVILRDVTHDRMNEATILETERINAIKLLAAGVAHEIGNPLNALNIHLQLLERASRKLGKDQRENFGELVEIARREVARLDAIITQFLRAVRPAKMRFAQTRVEVILKETLALLQEEMRNRRIEVEINTTEGLPKIRTDRNQIKQAFFNIIKNAFQAMPDGGALRINVSEGRGLVKISFADSGQGIDPGDLGRIFDPYYTTKGDGSGLGLMIVQRIIQDHGGQIEILSKPGEGTVFSIMLPAAERRIRLLKAHKGSRLLDEGDHMGDTRDG